MNLRRVAVQALEQIGGRRCITPKRLEHPRGGAARNPGAVDELAQYESLELTMLRADLGDSQRPDERRRIAAARWPFFRLPCGIARCTFDDLGDRLGRRIHGERLA